MRGRFPCTFEMACYVLYLVEVLDLTQTEAAIRVGLNVGSVNHVIHGRRHPTAHPVPPPS
jgi:4-hydroxy-3-methylbut-2-en-1-yl diphosphate synthase IspG/GcpE